MFTFRRVALAAFTIIQSDIFQDKPDFNVKLLALNENKAIYALSIPKMELELSVNLQAYLNVSRDILKADLIAMLTQYHINKNVI